MFNIQRVPKKITVPLLFLQYFWIMLIDFNIFSPLQSAMISAHSWYEFYHLALIALPHYRVKCSFVKTRIVELLFSCNEKDIAVMHY